jgi:rhamnulokinase
VTLVPPAFLAVDLGAESGRVVRGSVGASGFDTVEVSRFANRPLALPDRLAWNVTGLLDAVLDGIAATSSVCSVGIDGWGVDVALLRCDSSLAAPPRCYRDPITAGVLDDVDARIPRRRLFERTGIQAMEINTLGQLVAAQRAGLDELREAAQMLLIPDLLLHWLGADPVCERTNASTTQMLATDGAWAGDVLDACGLRRSMCAPVVQPGTVVGRVSARHASRLGRCDAELVAVASHDTASAVLGTPLPPSTPAIFISSGTWSLVGMELHRPVLNRVALACNLSNEQGYGGTVRLLRNVAGLWLLQQCRAAFATEDGVTLDYTTLTDMAARADAFIAVVDPDDAAFLRPGDLPNAVLAACDRTGEARPHDRGTLLRVLLESLALRYRWTIDALRAATGISPAVIHVVGGGSRNALLCRLTADATGLPVVAGPVEATVLGNLVVQAISAGVLGSVVEARGLLAADPSLHTYEPRRDDRWDAAYVRFCGLVGVPGAAETATPL